eukprot:gnl/Dysnectes_brevis/4602_a6260_749.p1 GENE.gnl/Dysnectes_brevis/4602_a6260_749~~gnl/Dysnectes_brevis/4602_a6260_749.p1  ORF type:complete len:275 (-),score=4.55 gnl/Dysnectes_brevis/4602_a6260_749:29-853(-)
MQEFSPIDTDIQEKASRWFEHPVLTDLTEDTSHIPSFVVPRARLGPPSDVSTLDDQPKAHEICSTFIPSLKLLDRDSKQFNELRKQPLTRLDTLERLNLSYQDLGRRYQQDQLTAILVELSEYPTITELNLSHNDIKTLSGIDLPYIERLYLDGNSIQVSKHLPHFPSVTFLSLRDSSFHSLKGLSEAGLHNLRHIILEGSPLSTHPDLAERLGLLLPHLETLDGHLMTSFDRVAPLERRKGRSVCFCCCGPKLSAPQPDTLERIDTIDTKTKE